MKALLPLFLLLLLQEDPFKTLADPAKRAGAVDAFRAGARDSAQHFVAARFLERSERQWRLVYDKLKTGQATYVGTIDGEMLVTFGDQRMPVKGGTVEKNVKDPVAAELDAFLAKHWAAAAASEKQHRDALEALVQAIEKSKGIKSEAGPDVFNLFALAHLSALGEKAVDLAAKFGFVKEGDRLGRKDDLALYAIAQGFAKPGYVPAEAEKTARESARFGPRYVALLLDVQKTYSANTGFDALRKQLLKAQGTGAPKNCAEHYKALADGVTASTQCGCCKNGKVVCDRCDGKKKSDITCGTCKGLGWSPKNEEVNRLVKCVQCHGVKIFKNADCPNCKGTGAVECIVCLGKGWRDNFKGCKECRICAACHGRRVVVKDCGKCGGKGRVPPEAMGIPTILCPDCKGVAWLKEACKDCGESGLLDCKTCGGKGARDGKSEARPKLADIFTSDPCDVCAGRGWPLARLAVPCERCYGLGARVKPTSAPSKLLE